MIAAGVTIRLLLFPIVIHGRWAAKRAQKEVALQKQKERQQQQHEEISKREQEEGTII